MAKAMKSSAEKQAAAAVNRRRRNKAIRSEVKTGITRAEKLIFAGDLKAAQEAVTAAISSLDRASGKGILKGNNASRHKSRLMRKLNQAAAAKEPAGPAAPPGTVSPPAPAS